MRNVLIALMALTLVTGCGSKAANVLAPNNRAIEIAAKGVSAKSATVTKLVQTQQTFEIQAARQAAFEAFVATFFAKRTTKYKLIRLAQRGDVGATYGLAIEGSSTAQIQKVFGEFSTAWQAQAAVAAPAPAAAK